MQIFSLEKLNTRSKDIPIFGRLKKHLVDVVDTWCPEKNNPYFFSFQQKSSSWNLMKHMDEMHKRLKGP